MGKYANLKVQKISEVLYQKSIQSLNLRLFEDFMNQTAAWEPAEQAVGLVRRHWRVVRYQLERGYVGRGTAGNIWI